MGKIKITLIKGRSGRTLHQLRILQTLGLKKRTSTVEVEDNPVMKGMVKKVNHLIFVEELK